jgi:hypothetical protein
MYYQVLVSSPPPSVDYLGMVSDRGVLSWFYSHAKETPALQQFLSNSLNQLSMPSLNIYASVIAAPSTATVLDAMKLMSDQGVSNVAVLDDETGTLLSAVSVTDIGKVSRFLTFLVSRKYCFFSDTVRSSYLLKAIIFCQRLCINLYLTSKYVTSFITVHHRLRCSLKIC